MPGDPFRAAIDRQAEIKLHGEGYRERLDEAYRIDEAMHPWMYKDRVQKPTLDDTPQSGTESLLRQTVNAMGTLAAKLHLNRK